MSYKENTLKFKKLLFKLKYLYAELDECNYKFDICKNNFSLEFHKKIVKLKKKEKNVIKKVDEQIKNSKPDNKNLDEDINPKSFKNLYRKIAFETHPDKGHSKRRVELFNEAKEAYMNGSWFNLVEIATTLEITLPIPTKQQLEYVDALLDEDKYGDLILTGIAGAQITEDKGIMNYEPLMQTLDELSSTMVHDKDLKRKMENAGVNHQNLTSGLYLIQKNERNREAIEEAKRSGEFQSSLDRLAKEDVNVKMEELAKKFATMSGLDYMTDWEREQLIDQGFSQEDLD